jgi:large subunit ribosomal protein L4
MATVKVYDQTKNEVGSHELSPEVFEVEVKPEILHLVVRQHMANQRRGTHKVKTRSEVRGGGRKPWRQKGTGRARAGTIRSPLWRGGGIVFGPAPRDYGFKINKKIKKLALKMALSSKLAAERLLVVDDIKMDEIKTKRFAEVRQALELGKCLIVLDNPDNNTLLSARNLPGMKVVPSESVNVYDILKYPQLVMGKNAVASLENWLTNRRESAGSDAE